MNRAVKKESTRKRLETRARNRELRMKAVRACAEINPENSIAAAEAMPELFKAAKDAAGVLVGAGLTDNHVYAALVAAVTKATIKN